MVEASAQVKEETAQRAGDTEQRPLPPRILEVIDWQAPWLQPWHALGAAVAAHALGNWAVQVSAQVKEETAQRAGDTEQRPVPSSSRPGYTCADALNAAPFLTGCAGAPVRFVPQTALPTGEAYEAFIYRTGQVPTRDGLHDFFNGLAWLLFPQTKRRLNQLHVAQIAQTGIQPVRGPARDALTVFDENAAFLQCPDALWEALAAKDWQRLFVTLRPLWKDAHLVLFGHALLEKLVYPRKPITAHVYRARVATVSAQGRPKLERGPLGGQRPAQRWSVGAGDFIADLDAWMAQDLSAEKLASKPFAHLPVLGVPGWCLENAEPAFYADTSVFRAPRAATASGS